MQSDASPIVAVQRGDHEAVLATGHAAASATDQSGKLALAVAAQGGFTSVVEALLKVGAKDTLPDAPGWSATMHAAFSGHVDVLTHLLAAGGACLEGDADGTTPLHLAAMRGNTGCARAILNATEGSVDVTDSLGRTPLMLAASSGSVETIELLMESGASVSACSNDGKTSLHWAVISHQPRTVEALVKAGAAIDAVDNPPMNPVIRPGGSKGGSTPFDYANERLGKDPVLRHVSKYLEAARAAQVNGGEIPEMNEMAWLKRAAQVATQPVEEAAEEVEKPAPSGDIWGDDDEPAIEELQTGEGSDALPSPANAEGGVSGELDELD